MFSKTLLAIGVALLPVTFATPIALEERALANYVEEVTIHSSCNTTQRRQLTKALSDTWELVSMAKEYTYTNGANDSLYELYFGDGPITNVIGAFDAVLKSNKDGVLLRCDDIDGNCRLPGWRGHWRGENGTAETVICDASYTDRKSNDQFCAFGYTVAGSSPSYYFGTDLLHRLYHVPQITDGKVEHYADSYDECLDLAKNNATFATLNTHSLQYYANHVFAIEVAQGGESCIGRADVAGAASAPATATSSAALACHTHADGALHCE
ncbi:hypothetical protein QFC22_005085 [Naganishia vaughanmartiniae]|uniref:Uncharacterized protein n=1 Tax=Naganishia vaughanmartiniae TaxID=1424756 RepID=A0ACC2WWB8_9TREE|nr:hypothetical protein QFC22_005085 [Naganishia vaughanmartiniae]